MKDKVKIKQEIERGIEQCYRTLSQDLLERERNETNCCLQQYKELLQFIDSLPEEPASEDLEEEIDRCYKSRNDLMMTRRQFGELIHHFAKWQEKQMLGIAEAFYEQGRFEQKQEMMKNTVLETKVIMDCDGDGIETPYEEWLTLENTEIPYIPDGFKDGDMVKVILVKEDLP